MNHPAAKAFVQHGFNQAGESGDQINGFCPLCGRTKSPTFYFHRETKAWDCKACGKSGGFLTFLDEMSRTCELYFKGKIAVDLSKDRGLPIDVLRHFHVGFNPLTGAYTLPVYGVDGKIIDLRYYFDKKLHSTYSCRAGLFNAYDAFAKDKIYLCEGEWDGMAMWDVVRKNDSIAGVVAVPGANVLKPDWIDLFQGKRVIALYDADDAGRKGAQKCFNLISPCSKSLYFLHWPEDKKEGYDIRDLYRDIGAENVMKFIDENIGDIPPGTTADEILQKAATGEVYTGDGLPCSEVYEGYKKYLHIPDTSVIDIIYGTIIANRLDGDPIWLFLVAPPGMTKTEFLQSVSGAKNVKCVSKLTPKSLVSGLNISGHDPSLLPQLNGKTLIIKDFTAIFGMNAQARDEVFSTLRDAYDGNFVGVYGHGERNYVSKFGIIAGVTPAIEVYLDGESALGERFLRYTMRVPKNISEHIAFLERATDNVAREKSMREELKKIGTQCLDFDFSTLGQITVPKEIKEKLLYLALYTTRLRATIVRDRFTKEVTHKPFLEMATRLSKQFLKLIIGIAMFRRIMVVTNEEYRLIVKLACGTVPSRIEDLVSAMYAKKGATFTQSEMAELVRLPNATCARLAENLTMLDVLESNKMSAFKVEYRFTDEFLSIIEKCEVYS